MHNCLDSPDIGLACFGSDFVYVRDVYSVNFHGPGKITGKLMYREKGLTYFFSNYNVSNNCVLSLHTSAVLHRSPDTKVARSVCLLMIFQALWIPECKISL